MDQHRPLRPGIQFSLQSLFGLTTVAAVLVWLSTQLAKGELFYLVPLLAIAASLAALAVLRDGMRAFALGFGLGMFYTSIIAWLSDGDTVEWRALALLLLFTICPTFTGVLGLGLHKLGEMRSAAETPRFPHGNETADNEAGCDRSSR